MIADYIDLSYHASRPRAKKKAGGQMPAVLSLAKS